MYVIYQCYEHLATLTIPPAPYCPRATGLNLWVSGKSGPEYGIGPGCKARLIMKQLEKYFFFFVFYLWRKRSKEVERKRKEKRKERNTRRQRIGDWRIKEERKALFAKTLPLSSQFNNIQHRKGAGMDKNMLAGLDGLPEQDKARMAAMIDHLQLRDRFWFFSHFALLVSLIFRFYISCSWIYRFFLDWIKKFFFIISQSRWIILPFFVKKDSFLCFSLFLWNSTLGFSFGFHLWLCMWNLCNASCKLSFCPCGLVDMWS